MATDITNKDSISQISSTDARKKSPTAKNKQTKIVVGMSGGVDSSTTAKMLQKAGYEVIGLTLRLCNDDLVNTTKNEATQVDLNVSSRVRSKHEIPENHIRDAIDTADEMQINHVVLDYGKKFQDIVISEFISDYTQGRTPSPCVTCNRSVKFEELINYAKSINADKVATGHYVRKVFNDKTQTYELHRGEFHHGDQSYFLSMLTQEQIDMIEFPLGEFKTKKETRDLAEKLNVPTANKKASQDICFTAKKGHADFISKAQPSSSKEGLIINTEGKIIGKHKGIIHYTVGQRKGINISHSEPLYVIKIDAKSNTIVVGEEKYLYRKTFLLDKINWLHESKGIDNYKLDVKIRIGQNAVPATLKTHNDKVIVILEEPQKGIAPGQLCAFYENTRTLGGGWIS